MNKYELFITIAPIFVHKSLCFKSRIHIQDNPSIFCDFDIVIQLNASKHKQILCGLIAPWPSTNHWRCNFIAYSSSQMY